MLFSVHTAFAKDMLTKEQAQIVIDEIDLICADTWCSGDYNFRFLELDCNSNTNSCQLNYEMFIWEQEKVKLSLNCVIRPIKSMNDMVSKSKKFYALKEQFYAKVSNCLENNMEDYGPELK